MQWRRSVCYEGDAPNDHQTQEHKKNQGLPFHFGHHDVICPRRIKSPCWLHIPKDRNSVIKSCALVRCQDLLPGPPGPAEMEGTMARRPPEVKVTLPARPARLPKI